ncbi:MAG: ATP-binding cassette domain-containing protein [Thermodesulfobacteriota bacterium]|nr:ATP-binding cassette domain-containing protein [Thermodesulfobacteriota bacterium]
MAAIRLHINNVWYKDNGKNILQGVNLAVPCGEGIGLCDPTGLSGAELLQICATLLEPTQGEIYLDGIPIPFDREIDLLPLRRKIAYVAEDTALISNLTLLQNVSLGWAYYENKSLQDVWEEGERLLTYFQVNDYKDLHPTEVNAEIFKRAVCAREMAKKPILILLDRIIDTLSTEGQTLLMSYVGKCLREMGSSLLVASTSAASFASLSALISRSYTLEEGRLAGENPACGRPSPAQERTPPGLTQGGTASDYGNEV